MKLSALAACTILAASCLIASPLYAAPNENAGAAAPADPQTQGEDKAEVETLTDENGYYVGGPVYVSDQNRIWTRSGPGTEYRITGSKRIGEKLTFISYSQNGAYLRLEDEDGKIVWMDKDTVQPTPCGAAQVGLLEEEVRTLKEQLENYDNALSRELKQTQQRLSRLERENKGMTEAIAQKDATIAELDELRREYADRLETKELDMQMRWWMQGALIALSGAIAGIIFLYIPRPNRKTKRERF